MLLPAYVWFASWQAMYIHAYGLQVGKPSEIESLNHLPVGLPWKSFVCIIAQLNLNLLPCHRLQLWSSLPQDWPHSQALPSELGCSLLEVNSNRNWKHGNRLAMERMSKTSCPNWPNHTHTNHQTRNDFEHACS